MTASRLIHLAAILFTALALVPGGAHFFELPHKMALPQSSYFTVQGIYRGWNLFGIVLIGAVAANLTTAWLLRNQPLPAALAGGAGFCILATLAIFFVWTYPANRATANWTRAVGGWETLRLQWEYSHAANAAVTFLALAAIALSALVRRD